MIKSSKITLKYSNDNKIQTISSIIDEYKRIVKIFIDILWDLDYIPKLLDKSITSQIDSWLSARMIQCAGKQASGIVRGTKKKQEKRLFIYNKLNEEGKFKKARNLKNIIESNKVFKPSLENVELELDSRFISIDLENNTSFDGWINLSSIGNKISLRLPFKKSKHFNKLFKKGCLKGGLRLSKIGATFNFELVDKEKKENGFILGMDIGVKNVISCSNGHISKKDIHNHDLDSINDKLSRKKKGSKGFKKVQDHRKNYINWTVNQLNLDNVKEVRIENIKNLRKGKRSSKKLSHWTYTDIFSKIEDYCNEQGVLVVKINPTYTSKRCSVCGWTRSRNRKGKLFKCGHCGNIMDSDLNASINISMSLKPIYYKQRQQHDIKKGFFWNVVGKDIIVPSVNKTDMS